MNLRSTLLLVLTVMLTCLFCFSVFSQIPSSGLVAYWPMNGNYTDAGPNGIHGTNAGSTATTNKFGVAANAMDFNNPTATVSQYATHPVNSNLSFGTAQNFSVSFLCYFKSPWVHTMGLYDNNLNYNGPGIWFWQSGGVGQYRFQFNYRNGSLASTPQPLDTWLHVTCTRTSGTLRIYINGILNASGAEGTGTPAYSYPARFGTMFYQSLSPPNYNPLHGRMDELRIYNRALSAAEIGGLAITTLPLTLGDFNAVRQNNSIQLNWLTRSEENTNYFEVERSADGVQFSPIGRIPAAGQSTDTRHYQFTDIQPLGGTGFYRLRMTDQDQTFRYSKIVAVRQAREGSDLHVQLFPNPASSLLQWQIQSSRIQMATVQIHNGAGLLYYQQQIRLAEGLNSNSIPLSHLPPGFYLLTVDTGEGRRAERFLKK